MITDKYKLIIEPTIDLPPESLALARKALLNSGICTDYAKLVGTGVANIGGVEMIYFNFSYGDIGESTVYAE